MKTPNISSIDALAGELARQVAPPPAYTVSQWADAERRLSPEASSEPGRWDTNRAPYQREIMDAVNDPGVEQVVVMSSAQVGKTEIINNIVGYYITHDPAPILVMQPTVEMVEAWSKDRLAPMIRDTPVLSEKIAGATSRTSGNTLLHKSFPGGQISMAGANAPATLASRPKRIILCDEVDRYPRSAGTEGDPVGLAVKRAATFWNRKIVLTSTPTLKGLSRIEEAYEQSTQEIYVYPCPSCGHEQPLRWHQIVFDKDDLTAPVTHVCKHCGVHHTQHEWQRQKGRWHAQAQHSKRRGFHLNELYSPWRKWIETVEDFLEAKGNTERLKLWVNTSLGETWEDEGERVDPDSLLERVEDYRGVPTDALVLTAGVDVQRDRLEVEVVGWGLGEESWTIDRRVFWGDPTRSEVWQQLDDLRTETWKHAYGSQLAISAMCVDSSDNTEAVYGYCRGKTAARVFAIKGRPGDAPVVGSPSRKKSGSRRRPVDLFPVGVDTAKATIYSRIQQDEPGPGYCHFSKWHCDAEYFAQLTAETLVTRYIRGFPVRKWELTRANKRNEALDCRVYAWAALKLLAPNWNRIARRLAPPEEHQEGEDMPSNRRPEKAKHPQKPEPKTPDEPEGEAEKPSNRKRARVRQAEGRARRRRGGGYVQGWR